MGDFYRNISREYDFWPFLGPNFQKIRVPSENIDVFPSIDIYKRPVNSKSGPGEGRHLERPITLD